ncbi:MAG: hypothetical protein GF334_06190 [Candidatus Altiarchaeales archaeon]|nr:hypothetical protein [Candidatus Altiarchaeales archaeon]
MHVVVSKKDLKLASTVVQKALPKVVVQEERGHLLFTVSGDDLLITGTNNDLKASYRIKTQECEGSGAFTISPKILTKVLVKVDADTIRIEFDKEEHIVKIYTKEDLKSYTSAQSFPADKMLTFTHELGDDVVLEELDRNILAAALGYAASYLPDLKEDMRTFDQMLIDKGIIYSANGLNKMGFFVCKQFQGINKLKIRKTAVPLLAKILSSLPDEKATLFESERDVGILTDTMRFSCLKSNAEPPEIPTVHLKSEGPYTRIDKTNLMKHIDRVVASNSTKIGAGIRMTLSGAGEDAHLDIELVANLKSNERIPCARVNDDTADRYEHTTFYTILKDVLTSLKAEKDVRLHVNDDNKFFKVYESGTIGDERYIAVGLGSYTKVVKQ